MTRRSSLILLPRRPDIRRLAHERINDAPDGDLVIVTEPLKKRVQEEKYHAMIRDISRQVEFAGRLWDADDTKRLLVDQFADDLRGMGEPLHHDARVFPSLDGRRIVQLGVQTSNFLAREASKFIEWLYAFGAEHDVEWTEPLARREESLAP